MATNTDRVDALRVEVDRLRRNNRWLTAFTALVGLGLVLSVAVPLSTVQSRRYALHDDGGRQRGMWRVRDATSAMILQDRGGRWRVITEIDAEGPRLSLHSEEGEPLIELRTRDAQPAVTLRDSQGRPRLRMSVSDDGGRLVFLDENGEAASELDETER